MEIYSYDRMSSFQSAKFILKKFTIYGIYLGLFFGVIYSVGGLCIDILVTVNLIYGEQMGTPELSVGSLLAFGALVGMPMIFAVAGFIIGLLLLLSKFIFEQY